MSLKKIISHIVLIGSLLIASPAGAVSKHMSSSVESAIKISQTNNKHPAYSNKWYAPIWAFGPKVREVFTCIIHRESRSTWSRPKVDDGTYYQYGIFQINWSANIWQKYVEPILHITLQQANAREQALGAAIIFRIDGYFPWKFDGCPEEFGYYYP